MRFMSLAKFEAMSEMALVRKLLGVSWLLGSGADCCIVEMVLHVVGRFVTARVWNIFTRSFAMIGHGWSDQWRGPDLRNRFASRWQVSSFNREWRVNFGNSSDGLRFDNTMFNLRDR